MKSQPSRQVLHYRRPAIRRKEKICPTSHGLWTNRTSESSNYIHVHPTQYHCHVPSSSWKLIQRLVGPSGRFPMFGAILLSLRRSSWTASILLWPAIWHRLCGISKSYSEKWFSGRMISVNSLTVYFDAHFSDRLCRYQTKRHC